MSEIYDAAEFPHGLRCAECRTEFVEGQPISQRLDGMDDDGIAYVVLVCVACASSTLAASASKTSPGVGGQRSGTDAAVHDDPAGPSLTASLGEDYSGEREGPPSQKEKDTRASRSGSVSSGSSSGEG